MIELYTFGTPNGHEASIMLEGVGVPHEVHDRYDAEVRRLLGVLDGRLSDREYICGAYGLADVMTWTWVDAARGLGIDLAEHPAVHVAVGARPAVQRGMAVPEKV